MRFSLILPAAGSSTRFGGPRNKLFELLHGVPVIVHSIRAFQCRTDVEQIIIPTSDPQAIGEVLRRFADSGPAGDNRVLICPGGSCRAQSVHRALAEVRTDVQWVAVHDAARPLVSQALIDRTLASAMEHGAAVPAQPVHLTIKQATGPLPARVQRTIARDTLWAMQTPQIMRRQALADAFERCPLPLEQITDDVQLIELAGGEVWLVEGEERNLKITRPADMRIAEGDR